MMENHRDEVKSIKIKNIYFHQKMYLFIMMDFVFDITPRN